MDTHARRSDPESSHLTSEINDEHRGAAKMWLLDALVRYLMSSFLYRQGHEVLTAARSAYLADFEMSDRAGYVYASGKWKRCSDLRKNKNEDDELDPWAVFLYQDGVQVKTYNPNTKAMVGVSVLTQSGIEAGADWMDNRR